MNDKDSAEPSAPPDVYSLLRQWEEGNQQPTYDPVPMLTTLSEIVEAETEAYMKMDPDPFDERHPSRAYPTCSLGHTLKVLFRKEPLMTKLVNDYLRDNYYSRLNITGKDVRKLNIAACRLMLDITPGLETSAVFEMPTNDILVQRLISWAEKSPEPLQTYATGLLAAAMEVQEIAVIFREQNLRLVPLMLERLHNLQAEALEERNHHNNSRPFAEFSKAESEITPMSKKEKGSQKKNSKSQSRLEDQDSEVKTSKRINGTLRRESDGNRSITVNGFCENGTFISSDTQAGLLHNNSDVMEGRRNSTEGLMSPPPKPSPFTVSDCSNSSWAEMETFVIGNIQMHPLTLATKEIFILKYLTPMGEYQEFLSHIFEKNALELILQFINLRETKNARLSFEALKYLAALLCHKKFSIEFINMSGLQKLLEVPRPSIAATGVSICLYYLAYCEDAMERVCLLPQHVVSDLVRYSLWLLECSHDSGRCHATMFFGLSFQFRVILEEFDAQDGLRKLYNVISTLPILSSDDSSITEDEECSARQIVRHVCVALKRYLEAHLYIRSEQVRRAHFRDTTEYSKLHTTLPSYKACKSSQEEVKEQINTLLEYMSFRAQWAPVDNLLRLGGVTLLLQIIAFAYEWNYSGRGETVRSALDVLCICSVMPRVQLQLCEKVGLPDDPNALGVNVILGAAEGEIVADPDVQKAALHVLITCVCAPIYRDVGGVARYSSGGASKKRTYALRNSEEIIEKLWECFRKTNGIMVLLNLITVKMPITDADSIRGLACEALAGLARSETVRQIISKLPLFTNGQLQKKENITTWQHGGRPAVNRYQERNRRALNKPTLETVWFEDLRTINIQLQIFTDLLASIIHRQRVIYLYLMRDPILQDRRQEHVTFQKFALELLERVSGKSKPNGNELEPSLTNIHRANVIAQTRIQFNDKELLQLIQQHLLQHGLSESATALQKEANLPPAKPSAPQPSFLSPFTYQGAITPVRGSRYKVPNDPLPPPTPPAAVTPKPPPSPFQPIKLNLAQGNSHKKQEVVKFSTPTCRSLEKPINYERANKPLPPKEINITLDSIITEYLTNQHALCKNPMATCPQFTLFEPHKCPDPKQKNTIPSNFAVRLSRGIKSARLDQKLIHSRFCSVHTFRYGEDSAFFTCCDFIGNDKYIVIGTQHGEVKLFNLHTGVETSSYTCHESYISHLQCSKSSLLLTSSTWRRPLSSCWNLKDNNFQVMFSMDDEDYVEFSKLSQDRVIGTKGETATIYDIATGQLVTTLKPTISNQYNKNRATFSPTDELVLSDGVLWDVNSGKEIHKLDKLNQSVSGVFHPNGLEVVSNTEVWDLRTFHLLRTVPALEQCDVKFSANSSVIYSVTMERETDDESSYETSFKTLDACDYSSIATIDVKKSIYDLSCNKRDTQIALVENQGVFETVQESIVKIYDVGRSRSNGDEPDEEEDDDDMEGSDGSGSDDDQHNDTLPLELLDDSISAHSDDEQQENNSSDGDMDDNAEIEILEALTDSSDSSDDDFYM